MFPASSQETKKDWLSDLFIYEWLWPSCIVQRCGRPAAPRIQPFVLQQRGLQLWLGVVADARARVADVFVPQWHLCCLPSDCYALFPSRARLPPLHLIIHKRSPENLGSTCLWHHFKSTARRQRNERKVGVLAAKWRLRCCGALVWKCKRCLWFRHKMMLSYEQVINVIINPFCCAV